MISPDSLFRLPTKSMGLYYSRPKLKPWPTLAFIFDNHTTLYYHFLCPSQLVQGAASPRLFGRPSVCPHFRFQSRYCGDFFHIAHTHPLGGADVFSGLCYDMWPTFSHIYLLAKIASFLLMLVISGKPCHTARPLP